MISMITELQTDLWIWLMKTEPIETLDVAELTDLTEILLFPEKKECFCLGRT